jgi:hypothetical protein
MSAATSEISMPELGPEGQKDSFSATVAERSIGGMPSAPMQSLHWKGRKVCSITKVVSALMNAVATSPGGDAPAADIEAATRLLIERAANLADVALPLVDIAEDDPQFLAVRNALREDAADTIAMQWRLAHTTGVRALSIEQIAEIYRAVKEADFLPPDGATEQPYPASALTAKRLALLVASSLIHDAVTAYGYYHPDPSQLVTKGVLEVAKVSTGGIERILGSGEADEGTRASVTQTFIERAAMLYAQNYRAHAHRDIKVLALLDDDERLCRIRENRAMGFSTEHIDISFARLVAQMVDMIIESAPELAGESPVGLLAGEPDPVC